MSFVHLHVRSEFSIVDSLVQIDALCEKIKSYRMPAVALTDRCNLFGMVKFYRQCMSMGIKPIIGSEIAIGAKRQPGQYSKVVLLCQNMVGYRHLTRLISRAYQEGERLDDLPLVKKEWIWEGNEGLIALSGEPMESTLQEWMTHFPGRYYLEIQRTGRVHEKEHERAVLKLAQTWQCPVVASNEVIFLQKEDFEAHKARVCIQRGVMLDQFSDANYSEQQYLKTPEAMATLFSDMPSAIQNTIDIAKRCSLTLVLDDPILPSFPVPSEETETTYLEKCAKVGLDQRISKIAVDSIKKSEYETRLKTELSVINAMGFPGYFLIVADFIQWAKNNHIPVGPGRGSGAGSLVAYVLGITDLDPIQYELLFERFLNPERVSLPDFDIDFCMDNRDRVIEYVTERYGRSNVSQIATFGTMAAKAVIRDVGRILGHPYGFVDKIAKLVPFEIGITLEKALTQEPALKKRYDDEEEVKNLIELAMKLEGMTRNVGKHAGGVVIAPAELTDYAPLYCEQGSAQAVIQFDKDDVESIGLIKFDFLGLRTLTIIDWAMKNVETGIHIQDIPLNDPKTFQLLKQCQTTAVFQLESRGMKELIKRLQPDHFEEIIALVALFRPGPLQSGMVDDFINRKHGRAKVEYPHAMIEPILRPTYGVILYQEQVMQIAQTLAGYTLGGADLLRRAMGKKKPEEMAKQRTNFIEGAKTRGVDERTASYIFDLIEKFAGYGFNKSHSAAYALVSYQTAWLKAHYPSAFMAAVLSSDMMHTDKLVGLIEECRTCKIQVIPPDVHHSEYRFTVNKEGNILYGLGAIKGVGEAAVYNIIEERRHGRFYDLFDLCRRLDNRKINKRVIEALIKSGALDGLGQERGALMAQLEEAMKQAERSERDRMLGQAALFDSVEAPVISQAANVVWNTKMRLQGEKESLGMYFTGHPLEGVQDELAQMGVVKRQAVTHFHKDKKYRLAGLVVSVKTVLTRKGDRMGVVMLDDQAERYEVTVFPEQYQQGREYLAKDQFIVMDVSFLSDPTSGAVRIRAHHIFSFTDARKKFAKQLCIKMQPTVIRADTVDTLHACLLETRDPEGCPVVIEYANEKAEVNIALGESWRVTPSTVLFQRLCDLLGQESVIFRYGN